MIGGQRPPDWNQLSLHNTCEVACCIARVLDAMRQGGFADKDLFGVRLALEEALVNAIKHGHRSDPGKTVRLRYRLDGGELLIEIEDEGPGFDPEGVPDPLDPANLERPGGRGVFLIRHYMSWVSYNERGNCVTMCKKPPADAARG